MPNMESRESRPPLDGVRVVDLTQFVAGPMATMMLADQGAEVIKVESPGGGDLTRRLGGPTGMSAMFLSVNRSKRSVAIDLKRPEGRDIVNRLVATADLFVENFRPGVAARLGLDEPALRRNRPDLIYVSINGFGERGPSAHKRAYDPVIQAASGLADIQADPETGRPRMIRLVVPDKVTALTAAQAMTAALYRRLRDGEGYHVRLAMLDAVVAFHWPEGMAGWTLLDSKRPTHPWTSRRDLIFEVDDGYLTVGAVSDTEWQALARAVGHQEWIEDPRFRTPAARIRNADVRLELTAEALVGKGRAEWLAILDEAGVPCAPVVRRDELATDPQVVANGLVAEQQHPVVGRILQPRPAARFDEGLPPPRPAPVLGADTEAVLCELGLESEITTLRRSSVIP